MIRIENDCVDCGLPCMGDGCRYRNVPHIYCDNCKNECDEVYDVGGEHMCEDCLMDTLTKITSENAKEYI